MTLGPPQRPALDGSVRGKVFTFLEKLRTDDTMSGLHIEPINGTADPRVHTGRVDPTWRAVLMKLTASNGNGTHYIYLGTYPHDDAIVFAKKARLQVNPASGVLELLTNEATAPTSDGRLTDQPLEWRVPSPHAPPVTSRRPVLSNYNISRSDLLALGIAEELADRAIAETDENALATITDEAPAVWQGEALLELAAGTPLSEVRALYDLRPSTGDSTSDQSVIDALNHRATRMEFAYVEDDVVLRDAIEDDDFGRWRLFLHPEQSRYAEKSMSGSFRLSGGAGTGKTVVLLHRARRLAALNPSARILLTTFNRTLAETLRAQLALLAPHAPVAARPGEPGIYVGSVDAIAWHLLGSAARIGLPMRTALDAIGGWREAPLEKTADNAWRAALKKAGWNLPESLRTELFLSGEYTHVILPGRITTRDNYLRAVRAGRGVALSRALRSAVWDVVEEYRNHAAHAGTADFDERAVAVATALDTMADDGLPRLADHVLVDEAQDLSPSRLLLLRSLVAPSSNDLFIAEDSQQRIYSQRVIPSRLGIHLTGRSRRLTLNYRTTAQTLRYAVGVLGGEPMIDMENTDTSALGYRSSRVGPVPQVLGFALPKEACDAAANVLREWLEADGDPSNLAVLIRGRRDGVNLADDLAERGLPAKYVGSRTTLGRNKIPIMTMHRAKGMEFRRVLLFGVSAGVIPTGVDSVPTDERAEKLQQERSLLYVAVTRARDQLVIIWNGQKSELLPSTDHLAAR